MSWIQHLWSWPTVASTFHSLHKRCPDNIVLMAALISSWVGLVVTTSGPVASTVYTAAAPIEWKVLICSNWCTLIGRFSNLVILNPFLLVETDWAASKPRLSMSGSISQVKSFSSLHWCIPGLNSWTCRLYSWSSCITVVSTMVTWQVWCSSLLCACSGTATSPPISNSCFWKVQSCLFPCWRCYCASSLTIDSILPAPSKVASRLADISRIKWSLMVGNTMNELVSGQLPSVHQLTLDRFY